MNEPTKMQVPYEPYDNTEIATMGAIDYLMGILETDAERARVALWVSAKYSG